MVIRKSTNNNDQFHRRSQRFDIAVFVKSNYSSVRGATVQRLRLHRSSYRRKLDHAWQLHKFPSIEDIFRPHGRSTHRFPRPHTTKFGRRFRTSCCHTSATFWISLRPHCVRILAYAGCLIRDAEEVGKSIRNPEMICRNS